MELAFCARLRECGTAKLSGFSYPSLCASTKQKCSDTEGLSFLIVRIRREHCLIVSMSAETIREIMQRGKGPRKPFTEVRGGSTRTAARKNVTDQGLEAYVWLCTHLYGEVPISDQKESRHHSGC